MQDLSTAGESIEDVARRQNGYAVHLAKINESNPVISTENILNSDGVLLVPEGTRISHDQTQNILKHKLLKPIEEQVVLENIISNDKILQNITSLLNSYPDMGQIHERLNFQTVLKEILGKISLNHVLAQKITVLSKQITHEYEKSLLVAWFSALIAKEHNEENSFIEESFVAGLFHDIGFLHISRDIVTKKGRYTASEWRTVQCHVVIGQLLLKGVGSKYSNASEAILEHHERCDGSGYPVGKTDSNLDIMGQIIGISDSILAVRINRFENQKRNMKDLMPYLHMNSETHFRSVYDSVCSVLKQSELSQTQINACGTTADLVASLKHRGSKLKNAVKLLMKLFVISELEKNCSSCGSLFKVSEPVMSMITSSGIVLDEIFQWLDTLEDDLVTGDTLAELIEMELMQEELYWQLSRVCRIIDEFTASSQNICSPDNQQEYMNISAAIKEILSEGKAPRLNFKYQKETSSKE